MTDESALIGRVDTSTHKDPAKASDSLELLCLYISICGLTAYPASFGLPNGRRIGWREHRDLLMIWAQVNNIPRKLLRERTQRSVSHSRSQRFASTGLNTSTPNNPNKSTPSNDPNTPNNPNNTLFVWVMYRSYLGRVGSPKHPQAQ